MALKSGRKQLRIRRQSRLKQLRETKRLDQKELADKLGCSVRAVSAWETGRRSPNSIWRNKLSRFFGVEESQLLGDVGEGSADAVLIGEKRIDVPNADRLDKTDLDEIKKFAEFRIQTKSQAEQLSPDRGHRDEKPPKRVLIVEDEVTTALAVERYLKTHGYDVGICYEGLAAYKRVQETKFDIILLDLKMANMGGREFLRLIRKEGNNTPVVVLTGYPEEVTTVEVEGLKISGWLVKPVKVEDIEGAIRDVLNAKAT